MWSISLKEISRIKKFNLILALVSLVLLVTYAWSQESKTPPVEDELLFNIQSFFSGQWLPSLEPIKIGKDNFRSLINMRYTPKGIKGVDGYSKINTSIINDTCKYIRNGFHFHKNRPPESHILVQAESTGGASSKVYKNDTAIPDQGNFTATEIHTDTSTSNPGRMVIAPKGNVVYCNGEESMIWGGDELRNAAFITGTTEITNTITEPKDFTFQVQNTLTTADEIATIGGGYDSDSVLLLHCNGSDGGTTFTDDGETGHAMTAQADAQLDTDQAKFGTASGYFDGTGDYVSAADHADWNLGDNNFTIDLWVRFQELGGLYHGLVAQCDDADNEWRLFLQGGGTNYLKFYVQSGASTLVNLAYAWTDIAINTWYHISVVRGWSGNANDWALCIDGTAVNTDTSNASTMPNLAGVLSVGAGAIGTVNAIYHKGWLDEVSISKGIARWTSNFTPPARQYQNDSLYWVVGSTRPLQGVKFYVQTANSLSGQTVTAKEWNGASWTSLTTTDNTSGLSETGSVTWSSTVDTSQPKYLEGLYLYFYQFALSDGGADIYYCTVDAPWQDMVDIWDGVLRQPIQFQSQKDGIYRDYTLEVNYPSSAEGEFSASIGGSGTADHIIAQFEERMAGIRFQIVGGDENEANVDSTVEYWDGAGWMEVGSFSDLTSGGTETLNQTGVMVWSPPNEEQEFVREDFGSIGYSYKITFDGTLTADATDIDLVGGIPAQLTIPPFEFPSLYRDRVMLCAYRKAGEGNRVDYSLPNAPDVWNGYETSMGGLQSLYFGEEEPINAGVQLYNRFGANIYTMWVAFKPNEIYVLLGDTPDPESENRFRIYPVSKNIGCAAPLTLDTAEIGYNVTGDISRNVVIFLSNSGPYYFDGTSPRPIKGIENYFNPQNPECINFDEIKIARGAYDQVNHEYNLVIPSGAAITKNNTWLVYDMMKRAWYKREPGVGFEDSSRSESPITEEGPTIDLAISKFDGTGNFDGTDDYLQLEDTSGVTMLPPFDIRPYFTLDLWVRHDDHAGIETYITHQEDGNNRWLLYHTHGLGLRFLVVSGGTDIVDTGYAGEIDDTNWHHIALCKDGNLYGMYKDGTQISYVSDADTDDFNAYLYIGGSPFFDGHIDEVRIHQSNHFHASPNVDLTDTITVPNEPHISVSETKLLLHMNGASSYIPQALFNVVDTEGTRYLYGGMDNGYMFRINDETTYDDNPIQQVVETGEYFATEDIWNKVLLRQFKFVSNRVSQSDASVDIYFYKNTKDDLGEFTAVDITADSSRRLVKNTQNINEKCWSHRLKFSTSRSGETEAFEPIAWGLRGRMLRIDE